MTDGCCGGCCGLGRRGMGCGVVSSMSYILKIEGRCSMDIHGATTASAK